MATYPRVKCGGVELFDREGDRALGYVEGDKIYINAVYFGQSRAVLDEAILDARSASEGNGPWHGHIGGLDHEVERLIAHEFAHLLAETLPGYAGFARAGYDASLKCPQLAVSGYCL